MNPYLKTLILTDHSGHTAHNSLYALARTLAAHPASSLVHVASRGDARNQAFFAGAGTQVRGLVEVQGSFAFAPGGETFLAAETASAPEDYDLIWLRLPPPADPTFFSYLEGLDGPLVVNRPAGIVETGSKAFLLNFPEWTAPTRLIESEEDLRAFAGRFAIVLKPLRDYGGRGLVRIQDGVVEEGGTTLPLEQFIAANRPRINGGHYLAMQFLRAVDQGDKRILVAGDRILGASLRLPAPGEWLCNVAQGGTAEVSSPTPHEERMVAALAPELNRRGVLFFGVDTLVGNDGERVLSELNTNSIGGFPQAEAQSGRPVLRPAVDELVAYASQKING